MSTGLVWTPASKPHTNISSILTSGLAVYSAVIESGNFCFLPLVAESGLLCEKCRTANCARHHGTWFRKRIFDLCTGDIFKNLPILRVAFCDDTTKSMFPAELWRGKATVSSVLEAVSDAISGGVDYALQRAMSTGDGDEPFSERTLRRWIKRTIDRVPVAGVSLNFPSDSAESAAEKFENFLTQVHPHHLLTLRRQWGFAILDVPPPEKPRRSTAYPKPVCQNPCPPQNPPSAYLPRGTRSSLHRRGPSPDD